MKTSTKTESRFENDAGRYAAYLVTPEGRLRTDLALANVREFMPTSSVSNSLRALDVGCGTGVAGIALARLGIEVTLLDSSAAMLELAERTAAEAGVKKKITIEQGDAAEVADIFGQRWFDIILCHNVLEYVDDPAAVLRGATRLLRDSSAMIYILVRNQAGEAVKSALQNGDLAAAENSLSTEYGQESLYKGKVRLFTPEALDTMLHDTALIATARRGVRVISDYLPPQISRSTEYERIFALERKLGERQEFFGMARYMHVLGARSEVEQ
jgi:2-polyprenyl-3-methyl-5-hydroxy-6-metoxy-1,4-benzoquinol methylase